MRLFLTLFAAVLFLYGPFASAQQLILNDNGQSVVTGTITEIGLETMVLEMEEGNRITVNLDGLGLDKGYYDNFFSVGMTVRVIGNLDNREIDAERISKINGQPPPIITDID